MFIIRCAKKRLLNCALSESLTDDGYVLGVDVKPPYPLEPCSCGKLFSDVEVEDGFRIIYSRNVSVCEFCFQTFLQLI